MSIILSFAFSVQSILFFIGVFSAVWIIFNIIFDLSLTYKNSAALKNRLGMYFAHFGLAIFILGASVSENTKIEKELVLEIGETTQIGSFEYTFEGLNEFKSMNYDAIIATVLVSKNEKLITEINPEKRLYHSSESPMTEAGIHARIDRDLYVSLGNMIDENKWSLRIYDKPLIRFIWIGTIFMIIGSIFSIRFKKKASL